MDDCLTLCATSRLAQTLRAQVPSAGGIWRTPQAMSLTQWLAALADEALLSGVAELPQVLDPYAEILLWEKVIADTLPEAAAPLFDLQGMATAAQDAHALTRLWQIAPDPRQASEEARQFLAWQAEFLKRCRALEAIDLASQQVAIVDLICRGQLPIPGKIRFAGFDRETPLEYRLKAGLAARGCVVETLAPPHHAPRASACRHADLATECAAIARWAEQRLQRQAGSRLAIVAPDLAAVRTALAYALEERLHPELMRPSAAEAPRAFNISLGLGLTEQPLVAVALELLQLASQGRVEQQRLGLLLRTPGWSAAESEADGRAQFDALMRREHPYFTHLAGLVRFGERLATRGIAPCPQTLAHLAALLQAAQESGGRRRLPGQWAGIFRQWLSAAGWPGERTLSSHEYQARQAFLALLDDYGQLDGILGPLGPADAVRRLAQRCRQRIFQPETRGQPAIQVLGVLESAGLEFDALWVMGMSDDAWPPAPRPNPLLPAELLRRHGVARASAEIELDFAQSVHRRLLQAAPEVLFSWSASDGSRLLRPSPLLADLPADLDPPPVAPTWPRQLAESAGACATLRDAEAPPVAPGEKVPGGTWVLRAQAICPAWAYFRYRLACEPLQEAVEGLAASDRGTLVHGALEAFWRSTGDAATLAALSPEALARAIETAVASALSAFEQARYLTLPPRFRALESQRLQRLLQRWLDFERSRTQGFSVLACEQSVELQIEGIQVRMVVDRIDRLDDGRQIIIDYKTGASIDTANWAGERLSEPQLPIYAALAAKDPVAGIAFAKVLMDKPAFAGIAETGGLLPGLPGLGDSRQKIFDPERFPDWPHLLDHWSQSLHRVASEVRAGVAGVVVADEAQLAWCEVLPLLRLAERRRQMAQPGAAAP